MPSLEGKTVLDVGPVVVIKTLDPDSQPDPYPDPDSLERRYPDPLHCFFLQEAVAFVGG